MIPVEVRISGSDTFQVFRVSDVFQIVNLVGVMVSVVLVNSGARASAVGHVEVSMERKSKSFIGMEFRPEVALHIRGTAGFL